MSKRVVVASACAGALLVGVPLTAVAAVGGAEGPVNHQLFEFRDSAVSTASTTFHPLPGLTPLTCSRGAVAVTVSLAVQGGPVGVKVLIDEGATMEPGAVRFAPGASSYTFVDTVGPFEGSDGHSLFVHWRSPTGNRVTVNQGDVVVQYRDPGTCP